MATQTPVLPAAPAIAVRRRRQSDRASGRRFNWWLTGILAVCSLTILIPLYFAVAMSLKTAAQTGTGTGFDFPWPLHFSNFTAAWDETDTPIHFAMSVLVAAIAVFGEIAVSSIAAWAIVRNWSHWQFRFSFYYLLGAMFIPFPVIALAQVKLTSTLSLDNPFGVAILHILFALSFNVLIYSAFIRSIPEELEESARLDGCTTWQAFRQVVLPLLGPMNATVGIFAFLASWNDFQMPYLITANPKWQTLPVIQNLFQTQFSANYNIAFASYLMAMIPTIIGYIIAQRWIIAGIMRGSIK
jgi:raffinose/stachyose/melibiose transport system permease protein